MSTFSALLEAPASLVIELIALFAFAGAIGCTLLISVGRAASLDRDPSIDAVLAADAERTRHDIAV